MSRNSEQSDTDTTSNTDTTSDATPHTDAEPLLSVRGLKKHYPITKGPLRREVGRVRAVDGIDFDVRPGETVGLIGESGSGKSTAATSLLYLEDPTDGTVEFDGEDVGEYDRGERKAFRRRAQMVFQDPTSSFDPRMSIGESVAEPMLVHGMTDESRRRTIAEELLERVGLSADDFNRYPHELSGGQKQRAALARALVLNPDLLVADEPVSALDVSVQAEILALLADLQTEFDLSILLISHDMGVVREVCDRVAVMYLGEVVERGTTEELFRNPQHPYTRALVAAVPTPDPDAPDREVTLSGDVPDASSPPSGCSFHPRCPQIIQPDDYDFEQDHWREVMDFRVALAERDVDVDALRELAVVEGNASAPDAVGEDDLRDAIRIEYGIPSDLRDDDAEGVLSAAISDVASGDVASADERLSEEFSTVCERRDPQTYETERGNPAACHLHDEEVAEEQWEWASVD